MERVSVILGRIMLAIFGATLLAALALIVLNGLESHSYLIALALGAVAAAVLLWLLRGRTADRLDALLARSGAVRLGAALSLLCLAVHLLWVLLVRIEPFSDYETYWNCACALAFGETLPPAEVEYIAMYPHILGYASFLSLFLRIFGKSVMVGAVLNVVLTTLSGLTVYALCYRVLGLRPAVLAFLLWTVMPTKLMLNSLTFSEPLYTLLLLLFLLSVTEIELRADRLETKPLLCALLGLLLGLLLRAVNIVRPIAAIMLIAYAIWLLLLRRGELMKPRRWKLWLIITALLLGAYFGTGSAWDRRVERFTGEEPAAIPIYNIYVGFNEETQGQWSAEDMDTLFAYKHGASLSASEAQYKMLPLLRERLRSGIDFPRLLRSKLTAFLGNDELGGYTYRFTRPESMVKICMAAGNVAYCFLLVLTLAGLWRMKDFSGCTAVLLYPLFALGLTLAHMLVEVSNRYHYSLIPIFVIIAAFSFCRQCKNGRTL